MNDEALLGIGYWQAPGNVISAAAPGYRSAPPVLRSSPGDKPVVVVLADNEGTDTTDFIVPYAMLKDLGVAEVRAASSRPGTAELMPALRVRADETIAEFDRDTPESADVVIVPAMHRQDNPIILDFLKRQSEGGALIVSICNGAWVVANAGLFDGRRATGHWFSFNSLARNFPETTWVRDARIVTDGQVMSTTGVSAPFRFRSRWPKQSPAPAKPSASRRASASTTGTSRMTAARSAFPPKWHERR